MSALRDPVAAADPKRSAWVSANAGAGKTHTLANRVTRLLLAGTKPERILCLTYTKAAAAEMAGRLFERLGEWAMLDDAALRAKIAEIGALADDLPAARRLFAQALETPGGLKIQTIHSFCQYLLSRFPLEADVPASFEVLDDSTARELIAAARARVLERAGSGDAALAAAAAHLVTETSESRLQQILDAVLGNDRRKLERFFANLPGDGDALARAVRAAHGAGERDTPERVAVEFCDALDRGTLRAAARWMTGGSGNDAKRGAGLLSALALADPLETFEVFCSALLTSKREAYKDFVTKKHAASDPAKAAFLNATVERLLAADERVRAAKAASLAEAALVLADAVRADYAREKRSRGVLDYDDLIAETLRLLEKKAAAAWVLYKLDGGLEHILIDEAQDTSEEQWRIVRKLTEEFFAGESAQPARGRTVFAVGDEKQSIFSFQGADPHQFEINRRIFAEGARGEEQEFADVELITSRRSAPEILRFVDAVFADEEARNGLVPQGVTVAHEAHRAEAQGLVEVWPAIPVTDAPEPDVWRPVDVPSEQSPVAKLADRIADAIKSWTDGRTKLPGHADAIRPGDIMILMPRREPFAGEIIRRLKERGVAVAGADRLKLVQQIAVMDLVALGRFALLPEDDLNLAALLRSPFIGLSEEELFALAHGRKGTLWSELAARRDALAPFGFAHAYLSGARARADFMPPYEFYACALSADGMRTRLLARLGQEARDAIDEFLQLALEFEALNTPSLEGFLHWIERGDAEIKRDMERGRDEVRVMTVHGAKGLEADIVILPDTTALPDSPGKRGDLLFDGDGVVFPVRDAEAPQAVRAAKASAEADALREHRRLLYVALTRAKDRLYICGFESKKGTRPGSWYEHVERAAKAIGKPVKFGDETRFAIGDAAFETADAELPLTAKPALPDWVKAPPPKERERPRLIRPFDAAGMDEPAVLPPLSEDKRFARGLLVHAMLARLPEVAADKRMEIALAFLSARGIAEEEARILARETLAVIEGGEFAAAFAADARAEVAIVADLPELGDGARVSGRIDRLAVSDDCVLAVDFKTNRPPPARPEDVPALYRTQMALYRAALAQIFPGKRIDCALVWTDGPALMPLPNAALEAEIAAVKARLAAS